MLFEYGASMLLGNMKKTKIRSGMNSIKKILLSQALLFVFAWIGKAEIVILQHHK